MVQRLAEQARQGDGGGPAQVEGRLPSAGSCDTQVAGQQLGSQRNRSGSVGQHGRSHGTAASKKLEADAASQLVRAVPCTSSTKRLRRLE